MQDYGNFAALISPHSKPICTKLSDASFSPPEITQFNGEVVWLVEHFLLDNITVVFSEVRKDLSAYEPSPKRGYTDPTLIMDTLEITMGMKNPLVLLDYLDPHKTTLT